MQLVAAVPLVAPLVAAALAPSTGWMARMAVVADTDGQLLVFDPNGRSIHPPIAAAAPPARVAGIAFLHTGAGGGDKQSTFFASAIEMPGSPEAFVFQLYRLTPTRTPTPERRVQLELVKETNVTWPTAQPAAAAAEEGGQPPRDAEGAETALSAKGEGGAVSSATGAVATQAAPSSGRLVGLESMSGGSGGKGKTAAPAFLAARSDGVLVTISVQGQLIAGVASGVDGLVMARCSVSTLGLMTPHRLVSASVT